MDALNRKRLEWMRDATVGAMFPPELFSTDPSSWNSWGPAVAEAAKAALEEIDAQDAMLNAAANLMNSVSDVLERKIKEAKESGR